MVGGAREVMNGATPSLAVISSAPVAEALDKGGTQLSVSGFRDSECLESLARPSPHTWAPQELRKQYLDQRGLHWAYGQTVHAS